MLITPIKHNFQGISIIVCCYNSASRLPETLIHLSRQTRLSDANLELILVNNASKDDTSEVAKKIWEEIGVPYPIKIVDEDRPGLIYAREKGINESSYDYLLFCDDDNWLDENYSSLAYKILKSDPKIGVVGGRSVAVSDVEIPFWFSSYQGGYVVGVQNLETGIINERGYVWGAGMMFNKNRYLRFKSFGLNSLLTGRNGDKLSAGDDSEICSWFLIAGYNLWYDENLTFKHFIPQGRLTKEYFNKLLEGFKEANEKLEFYRAIISCLNDKPLNKVVKFIYYTIRSILNRNQLNNSRVEGYNFLPFPLFSKAMFDSKRILIKLKKSL
jgi:glycosyltransferase involved in cell wall biosynthesis